LVGSKRLDKCNVRRSTGGAGFRSERLGDLNGEVTDAARSSENEHVGACRHFAQIAQRLQGGAGCNR
jgi:hypothetical protein